MTRLRFHNTHSGLTSAFEPQDASRVTLYVCGPTVYDRAHIGNARSAVVFDQIFRILRHVYGDQAVVYARNFTDIDDKIMAAAADRCPVLAPEDAIRKLTDETIAWYRQDMADLGVLDPTHTPRATEFVPGMVDDVLAMIAARGAYAANGHVFFSAQRNPVNGTLSGRVSLEDQDIHRIDPNPAKEHPADFVLWKPSTPDQPGWPSPWGRGRPGWHIECTTMATRLLGSGFDIHGGGSDLVFPHHDNEISQAHCCNPEADYARTWMHNGMITVAGRKMSKSLGNFFTVGDLRKRLPGAVIRLALLSAHYRSSLDWTDSLEQSQLSLWRKLAALARQSDGGAAVPQAVLDALFDDVNTPLAIHHLSQLHRSGDADGLLAAMTFLGIDTGETFAVDPQVKSWVETRLADRAAARADRNWALSDQIRKELEELGIVLRDGASGTDWTPLRPVEAGALIRNGDGSSGTST